MSGLITGVPVVVETVIVVVSLMMFRYKYLVWLHEELGVKGQFLLEIA